MRHRVFYEAAIFDCGNVAIAMPRSIARRDVMERFWEKVDKNGPIPESSMFPELKTPCWWWVCTINKKGYAKFLANGKVVRAHKFLYEKMVGKVPVGLILDHKCRVRHCVNPDHEEPVTPKENTRRGVVAQVVGQRGRDMTHCKKGHAFNENNTYHGVWKNGGKYRACRTCKRITMAKLRIKRRTK